MPQDPSANQTLAVTAPGKVVLWGEYAVLCGAAAGVMAVDRYARLNFSTLVDQQPPQWAVTTEGFNSPTVQLDPSWFSSAAPPPASSAGYLLWHAAQQQRWTPKTSAQLHIDSSEFYQQGQKLGLGSSAATCTALVTLCQALAQTASIEANAAADSRQKLLTQALATHTASQQGAGSGIDVAASVHGGLRQFQRDAAGNVHTQPLALPANLHWQAYWTGTAASTPAHLQRFDTWRAAGQTGPLDRLVEASNGCTSSVGLESLAAYVSALRAFDKASGIGIYAQGHENLHNLSTATGVLYKPCGAGGGDLGVAFASDPQSLGVFTRRAAAEAQPISLRMATYGVTTQSGHH